jgi:hypothetical protein
MWEIFLQGHILRTTGDALGERMMWTSTPDATKNSKGNSKP